MAFTRARGFPLLIVIVAAGMGIPALFRLKVLDLEDERSELLRNAPSEPVARLGIWFSHGQPRILEALQASRFSADEPWIVSHTVGAEGEVPEVWGVDQSAIDPGWIVHEGLEVVVQVPAPRPLARTELVGENARGVQHFATSEATDGRALLQARIEHAIDRLILALPKDIEGASIVVRVGE